MFYLNRESTCAVLKFRTTSAGFAVDCCLNRGTTYRLHCEVNDKSFVGALCRHCTSVENRNNASWFCPGSFVIAVQHVVGPVACRDSARENRRWVRSRFGCIGSVARGPRLFSSPKRLGDLRPDRY